MSSLNINDLYNISQKKNIQRLETFDNILKKIHLRICLSAQQEKTFCFYQIPEFIIGVPLYNVNDLKIYLCNGLEKNGFKILKMEPNWLFISWEVSQKENKKIIKKNKTNNEFKSVDEFKPKNNFF